MPEHNIAERLGGNAKQELLSIITRVESLVGDRKEINENIKIVLEEAEMNGFDKKTIKEVIKIRKLEKNEVQEQEDLRDAYLMALGLL